MDRNGFAPRCCGQLQSEYYQSANNLCAKDSRHGFDSRNFVSRRLWPVSGEAHPKPFITLPDGQNLIQKTFLRASALEGVSEILTATTVNCSSKRKASTAPPNSRPFLMSTFANRSLATPRGSSKMHRLVLPADRLIHPPKAMHLSEVG